MTIQMMIQKIEFILQDIIYFLTKRLANKVAFLILGLILHAKRDRYQMQTV